MNMYKNVISTGSPLFKIETHLVAVSGIILKKKKR